VTFENETYKLNLKDYYYKLNSYTKNLIGRLLGWCLCNHLLLSGCAMMFTARLFGCTLR
jgi:hypothetical protein